MHTTASSRSRHTDGNGCTDASTHENGKRQQHQAGEGVAVPPAKTLRPTWAQAFVHLATYLIRNAVLCALAALFVVQPIYMKVVRLPLMERLSPPAAMAFVFPVLCHALPWLVINGVFGFMDSLLPETGRSPLLRYKPFPALGRHFAQYKLPRRPAQQPSARLVFKTVATELASNFVVFPLLTYLLLRRRDPASLPPRDAYIPGFSPADWKEANYAKLSMSFVGMLPHFMIGNLWNEIGFYVAHGTLHSHPTLYRTFHKQHHEYTGTISVAAEYAGLLESVAANTFPTIGYFVFMFLFGANDDPRRFVQTARAWPMFATWLWERLLETYETHSGYCFTHSFLGRLGLMHGERARFHDYHHTHNAGNYGSYIFMDMFLNTMGPYLRNDYLIAHGKAKREGRAAE